MGRPSHELTTMAEQVTGRGARGAVAAAAPQAAVAAAAVLAEGGNAFDAVVTAALAESVLLPPKCGLGGDLIALVLAAGDTAPRALVAVGGAAAGHAAVARSGRWRDVGPDSVGPPAAAAGHAALAGLGRLPRERLASPAIALARSGFAWASVCERLSEMAHGLVAEMHPEGTDYYPGGSSIRAGTIVRLDGLAAVLDEWVLRGEHLFDGPVGDAVIDAVVSRGGALRRDDFQHARAEWLPCATQAVDDAIVWATPAPTHGPSLLDALGRYADGPRTPAALHGAVMASIAEQRETLGDPGGTSIVSAADADGNAAIVVHSNSYPRFGSGIIVPGYQLPLANRAGRGFTPIDGHPNFPTAGRRPATTLHAWAVSDADGVRWLGGTPGGANQLPWNAQTLARLLGGETRPGHLVASPVWEWLPDDDGVRLEDGLEGADDFAVSGRVVHAARWACRSAQQVVRLPLPGEAWQAAADPRTVGLALGI